MPAISIILTPLNGPLPIKNPPKIPEEFISTAWRGKPPKRAKVRPLFLRATHHFDIEVTNFLPQRIAVDAQKVGGLYQITARRFEA
jgi:hypothetical protein